MPIIYSVVARGTVVLAEFSQAKGNFDQVSRRILEKIPTEHNSKMSYVYDR
jgi:vesicle-associated membrane protein 7